MQARAFPPCLPSAAGRNEFFVPGSVGKRAPAVRVRAVDAPSAVADLPPAEVTWQIVVGAVAGVTPFVVAGVEFSKRIIAQKKCEICGGSGLVMKKDLYVRCQGCGGFLPWQSWRRFFKG
ncbi:uncharacterized protein LOC100828394 isoform X2 [Brachypodium distachyon]|uniref:Viral late gene transcription factor 3 zinc ribbon domain-containing protein n=1 Tax=Brachypodium distachyon TaxID=15368 RepID=I1HRU9_BRADI|nr:uncharacterized protein LOC100828394 isoform X2 [Brachypodium distachyon]KQK09869.1 hypothetical protein BRADI_2g50620v3 [Brachypodium distachyon]|eukprot:XP_003569872.1 uncharacterized protein LOC100828394 isoform X2 [Brachypodium distachyon]